MSYLVAAAGRTHPGRVREINEDTLYVYQSLTDAVERGSRAIARQVQADPSLAGMSTTIPVMLCRERRIVFAQLGDSRVYYLRAKQPDLLPTRRSSEIVTLLCSDGLTDYVTESDIHDVVATDEHDVAADRLIALALQAGAPDNVTVIVAEIAAP